MHYTLQLFNKRLQIIDQFANETRTIAEANAEEDKVDTVAHLSKFRANVKKSGSAYDQV